MRSRRVTGVTCDVSLRGFIFSLVNMHLYFGSEHSVEEPPVAGNVCCRSLG